MTQLIPTIAPSGLLTHQPNTQPDPGAPLRPELLVQLAHVRDLLARELSTPPDTNDACLTCSFQAEDVLLLKLAMELRPNIPVLFLETGYHFVETLWVRVVACRGDG